MRISTKEKKRQALKNAFTWHGMYVRRLFEDPDNEKLGISWQEMRYLRDQELKNAGFDGLLLKDN